MRLIAHNEPEFTDTPPYCNKLVLMTPEDVVAYMRRIHPEYNDIDEVLLGEYMIVNHAWEIDINPDLLKSNE